MALLRSLTWSSLLDLEEGLLAGGNKSPSHNPPPLGYQGCPLAQLYPCNIFGPDKTLNILVAQLEQSPKVYVEWVYMKRVYPICIVLHIP